MKGANHEEYWINGQRRVLVVELVETAPDNVASLVMVTHPATAGS